MARTTKEYSKSVTQLRGASRFRIERELAETLQGRIYAGTDLVTNKPCVIKEAWRQLVHSGRSRKGHRVPENFLHERDMLMALSLKPNVHNGIVKGIDQWDDTHCYYYAMEYCCGELFDFISTQHASNEYREFIESEALKEQTPMKDSNEWIESVSKMFKQICESVAWMHDNNYCHLDLSLENTMIADMQSGTVKIIDLGLAQHFTDNDFTHQGKIGKLQYMCPEAYNRQSYDARAADVYCLGIMLFMMLIGAPPYQAPQEQNAAFNYFINGRISDVLKHWKRLRLVTHDALDLMNKIICYEPHRIDIHAILNHPFLRDYDAKQNDDGSEIIEEKEDHKNANNDSNAPPQSANIDNEMNSINQRVSDMSLQSTNEQEIIIMTEHGDDDDDDDGDGLGGLDETDDVFELFESKEASMNMDECDFLLNQFNLLQYSCKMRDRGWGMPSDWHNLNEFVLKYEVGFEDSDANVFMERYHKYVEWKKEKELEPNYDLQNEPNHSNKENVVQDSNRNENKCVCTSSSMQKSINDLDKLIYQFTQ